MKKLIFIAGVIFSMSFFSINCIKDPSSPLPTCTPSYFGHLYAAVTSPALGSNILFASKYHLTASSKLLGFKFDPLSASGSVIIAMYSDNAGSPGSLIAQTPLTAVSFPGPQTIIIPPQVNISAGNYWLACLTDSGSVIALDTTGSTGGSRYVPAPVNGYGALSATFNANGFVATDASYYILMNAYVACQ